MTDAQFAALTYLANQTAPVTAFKIGEWVGGALTKRAASASGAGLVFMLRQKGFADRILKRRGLYVYEITDKGRAKLKAMTEKPGA